MPGLLSASELAACQAMQRASFDKTVTVERPTVSQDILASDIETLAVVGTMACRIGPPSAALLQQYQAQLGNVAVWLVTADVSANFLKGDYLLTAEGDVLKVHDILSPHGYETARRAIVAEKR